MTTATLSLPADLGTPEQSLRQGGRGYLFLQLMFVMPIIAATRSIVVHRGLELIAPIALAAIGVAGILAVHGLARMRLVAVELHPAGMVTRRGNGGRLWKYAQIQSIRGDTGGDQRPAYLVVLEGDLQLRLTEPRRGEREPLDVFVRALASRAGLHWEGSRAIR